MNRRSQTLMIAVGLGVMLNPLNSSMVSMALPSLQEAFALDFASVSWIIFAFYVCSAAAQPVMGRMSDVLGRRRIFLTGLFVSMIASFAAAFAPTFGWLVALRILQSIGTSMMIAVGMAIVRVHVLGKQGSALAILSIFLSGAAAIGPFVGGFLIHAWDWRAIFLVNVPVAAFAFLLAWRVLPRDTPKKALDGPPPSRRTRMRQLDPVGILLFGSGLTALMLGLLAVSSSGTLSAKSVGLGLAGMVLLAIWVRHEWRHPSPFVPVRMFVRYPELSRVNLEFMLVNLLFYSIFFGLPSYLQSVRGLSELHAGWLMLSLGLCSLLAAPFAGRGVDRLGPRPLLLLSAVLMAGGSLGLAVIGTQVSVLWFVPILAAFGIANGLNGVAMQAALFEHTPAAMAGVTSGLFHTSRYLGTILSSLLIASVMGGAFTHDGLHRLGCILSVCTLVLVWTGRAGFGRTSRSPNR
ncbi:MFS transporter [Saccharibacillus brassicae]|uniref:MFS transporter n=1 Tax=Saccharibacillus brassicae TaxID=2583377 RepID=A0A4Y6V4N1_SACBS|nr:MFS transporter [Saccharibacillus brassicae]QDH23225.1 MFS transporter [Saccharibacillus brassicae]